MTVDWRALFVPSGSLAEIIIRKKATEEEQRREEGMSDEDLVAAHGHPKDSPKYEHLLDFFTKDNPLYDTFSLNVCEGADGDPRRRMSDPAPASPPRQPFPIAL